MPDELVTRDWEQRLEAVARGLALNFLCIFGICIFSPVAILFWMCVSCLVFRGEIVVWIFDAMVYVAIPALLLLMGRRLIGHVNSAPSSFQMFKARIFFITGLCVAVAVGYWQWRFPPPPGNGCLISSPMKIFPWPYTNMCIGLLLGEALGLYRLSRRLVAPNTTAIK